MTTAGIQFEKAGARATARNLNTLLLDRVSAEPDTVAFDVPSGDGWKPVTWSEVGARVRDIARGLRALGLEDEERCAILSSTRFEWIAADLAINCAGGATATIFPSDTAAECAFIVKDSDSRFVFAEDAAQAAKLDRGALPNVKHVFTFDGTASDDGWVRSVEDLGLLGRHLEFEARARAVKPDALATIIYTSGTTGRPKGVEITHDNWLYEAEALDALGILGPDDIQLLWLPLAHSFAKVIAVAQLRIGFRSAVDGRLERLVDNLAVVKPTFVAAVPRVFEKVFNKVVASAHEGGRVKSSIFDWALGVGRRISALEQRGGAPHGILALEGAFADRIVFSRLREKFGGRLRFFVSGSAPLSQEIAEFFHAAGVLVLEGYGLTESCAATFINLPERFRFGTVGPPLPGTDVKVAPEDGEILVRGRGVMRGYHRMPEATAETIDAEGWLRTGDIGELVDGFLKITDRKKDLIKTSNGKYVAPQALEGRLKLACPLIGQVLVHGNNRPYCTALVALEEVALREWAAEHDKAGLGYAELVKLPEIDEIVHAALAEANHDLASFETIKKVTLLPADLTIETGEITPTQKVKRKVVEAKYKALLDAMYA